MNSIDRYCQIDLTKEERDLITAGLQALIWTLLPEHPLVKEAKDLLVRFEEGDYK